MRTHRVLYRRWIIAVLVTLLLTMAYPPGTSLAATSGWHSPSANVAASGGDNDGLEVNPGNAYADGGGSAVSYDNGDGASRSDYHQYYDYGFDIPPGSTIQGIRVRLDWWLNDTSDNNRMGARLSWDGGMSWTGSRQDNTETTTEHTAYLGGASDTWDRTWSADEFSDANFRVQVECFSSAIDAHDFFLDWVPVEVTYEDPPPPALSINDVAVT